MATVKLMVARPGLCARSLAFAAIASLVGAAPLPAQTAAPADQPLSLAATGAAAAQTRPEGGAGGFFGDVWSDYRNFVSIENAKWLASGGTFALAVHPADEPLRADLQDGEILLTSSLKGGQEWGLASVQVPLALAWWAIGAATGSGREADAGRDLLRAQISAISWTYGFKFIADRTRPNGDARSFPSGHASSAFATAWTLQTHYGWKLGVPGFVAAGYTAASRLADNKHWASDVVFGAVVGMTSGRTVAIHVRATKLAFEPVAAPGGAGVLLSASR